jgi:chondroitin 4-sulfotransferase 11
MTLFEEVREGVRSVMPYPVRRRPVLAHYMREFSRAGLIFIHVPKTAGVSVSLAVYGRTFPHNTAAEFKASFPLLFPSLPSLGVVRNPWERCASAWRFAVEGGGKGPFRVKILEAHRYQEPAFSSFGRFVEEWLPDRDLVTEDHVFQPQHRFVADARGRPLVTLLGRMERLDELATELSDRLRRKIVFPRLNASGVKVDYRRLYTPRLADIVGRAYARDIELFGYSF